MKYLGILLIVVLEFGFLAPTLISAKNNELVILGFLSIGISIYFIYKLIKIKSNEKNV
jgi:hypothetical protein